jgi:TIR domain
MTGYRVFISYSHDETKLAQRIAAYLHGNGMLSLWDKDIAPGSGFHDEIKKFINYSHVFLPIITESSSARGWVHQEIGYAMALNIPVLPVTVGRPPGEMLSGLQAIRLEDAEADIPPSLSVAAICPSTASSMSATGPMIVSRSSRRRDASSGRPSSAGTPRPQGLCGTWRSRKIRSKGSCTYRTA